MKVTKENFNGMCGTSGFGPPDRQSKNVTDFIRIYLVLHVVLVSQE